MPLISINDIDDATGLLKSATIYGESGQELTLRPVNESGPDADVSVNTIGAVRLNRHGLRALRDAATRILDEMACNNGSLETRCTGVLVHDEYTPCPVHDVAPLR